MRTGTLYEELKLKLADIVPEFELRAKAELAEEILQLKRERNAVILGHNYMEPALFHSVPDFTGDSLALCRRAAETDKERIVFCGVRFMAETAKILNPGKTVLLPAEEAGCSLAESITAEDVRQLKTRFPRHSRSSTYVNTYADVKAESRCLLHVEQRRQSRRALARQRQGHLPARRVPGGQRSAGETGKRESSFPSRTGGR